MKGLKVLVLLVSLILLSACDEGTSEIIPEGGFNPLCSSDRCNVEWNLFFSRPEFPENAQVMINETIIIDECDPNGRWAVERTSKSVEFTIPEYVNITGKEKFSMRIYDMRTCYEKKIEHSFMANQPYTIKNIGGEKHVWIERD